VCHRALCLTMDADRLLAAPFVRNTSNALFMARRSQGMYEHDVMTFLCNPAPGYGQNEVGIVLFWDM